MRKITVTLLLVLALSGAAYAGDMPFGVSGNMPFDVAGEIPFDVTGDMPIDKTTQPATDNSQTTAGEIAHMGQEAMTEATLSLLQSILSLV